MKNNNSQQIEVYISYNSIKNPNINGYGIIIVNGNENYVYGEELMGSKKNSNDNKMILISLIKALQELKEYDNIIINTDYSNITDIINRNENTELYKKLNGVLKKHNLTFNIIKNNTKNKYIDRCKTLASIHITLNKLIIETFCHKI